VNGRGVLFDLDGDNTALFLPAFFVAELTLRVWIRDDGRVHRWTTPDKCNDQTARL